MSGTIEFKNRLDDGLMYSHKELKPLLQAALKKFPVSQIRNESSAPNWSSSFFELEKISAYKRLTQEHKNRVLEHCNRDVLEEAFYIEKSGMAYAAKMSLLAENNDERSLYALFCADEASHLHAIHEFMGFEPESPKKQPFLKVLDDLVHHGSFNTLVYMVQIILEGWGLHHYLGLASGCENQQLTAVLRTIIQDEAKHHGSGLVVLPKHPWTAEDSSICFEILRGFLNLVRIGPINLLGSLERATMPLQKSERSEFYSEWGGTVRVSETLETLKKLIFEHGPDARMLQKLEDERLLEPAPLVEFLAHHSWNV